MSGNDEQLSRVLTLLNEQGRGRFVTITPQSFNKSASADLDDDTKSELEFRLTAYFMRANSAENEDQRQFYGTLWGLVDSRLNPQNYKLTQMERNSAASGIIQFLENARPSFSGQSLVDAGSFIRGVLFPSEMANPHYVVNDQTYDMLEPSILFRTSYLYGAKNVLEDALKTLPPKFANAYPDWKAANNDFTTKIGTIDNSGDVTELEKMAEASEPQGINFIELKRQHQESSDIATSANIKRLYALMMKFNDDALNKEGWKYTPETQKEFSDILAITVNHFDEFNDSNRKHVQEFIELLLLDDESAHDRNVKFDRNAFAITFSTLVNPIKKAVLFGAIRNVGLEERLQKILTDTPALRPILRAYDNWKISPQATKVIVPIEAATDTKAEPVTLQAQGRAAELMVLRAQYEMRANEISTQEQKVFYYSLMILCERALGVKETKEYQFKNLDDKDLDVSTPEKLSIAVLASLGTRKSKLDQQAQKDAKEFIHGFLIARNPDVNHEPLPFIPATDAFYDAIPPEFLFELAFEYDEIYCFSAPNMGLPENIMSAYAKWRHIHGKTVGENDVTKLELAQRGLSDAQANDDKVKIHFYEFLIEEQSLFSGAERDGSYNQKREELIKIKAPQFISWALRNFNELGKDERGLLSMSLQTVEFCWGEHKREEVLEKQIDFVASHVSPITDFFHLTYLLDLQVNLHKMIGGQYYPKPVLKAYRDWKDTPQALAFKASCKEGRKDKALVLVLSEGVTKNNVPIEDLDLKYLLDIKVKSSISFKAGDTKPSDTAVYIYGNAYSFLDLARLARTASSKSAQEVYHSILIHNLTTDASLMRQETLKLIERAVKNFSQFEATDVLLIGAYIKRSFKLAYDEDSEKTRILIELQKDKLKAISGHAFFQFIHLFDIAQTFEEEIKKKNFIPIKVHQDYTAWKKLAKSQTFIADCETRNSKAFEVKPTISVSDEAIPTPDASNDNPPIQAEISSPIDPRLFIHQSEQTLVVRGTRTDSMGIGAVDKGLKVIPSTKKVTENINKTENLYRALLVDDRIVRIDVYRDVRTEEDDKKTTFPYDIIQIKKDDGSLTRILVCDFENHLTYVERDAEPYVKGDIVQISDLLKNQKVWTARHITDDQWIEKVRILFSSDLASLAIEHKFKNNNSDLGGVLVSHFARTVMMTGNIPAAHDPNIFQLGVKKTSWSRLYNALQEETIEGLEGHTTFRKLFNYLARGQNAPMPCLLKFENKPQITAQQVLDAVEEYELTMGEGLTLEAHDLVFIDKQDLRIDTKKEPDLRRTGIEVSEAFKRGAVFIPEGLLPEGSNPRNLVEFLELVEQKKSFMGPECKAA